ncbi:MAG: isoprenyl transferase [Pseudomonadota bacterium]
MERPLPRHLAIIMDGNGRWAQARGLERVDGHREGAQSVREIVRACRAIGIQVLTLYSFSTENWKRPTTEVRALMSLLKQYLLSERQEMLDTGIRLRIIGQLDRLPGPVQAIAREICRDSDTGRTVMDLNLAVSYGGRAEVVQAVRSIAESVRRGELPVAAIDEALIGARLQTAGQPDPDLLIRTSGEFRISNFLLWQLAYSEFYVADTLWPDFRKPQLLEALDAYQHRERRYGGLAGPPKGGV